MKVSIVKRLIFWDEQASLSAKGFSFNRTEVHKLWGECGHVRYHRGFSGAPKKHFNCKDCAAGKPRVALPEVLGTIDKTQERNGLDVLVEKIAGGNRD